MANSRREYLRRTRKVRMRELGHSWPGWIGLLCGLAAAVLFLLAVIFSYRAVGDAAFFVGSMALFALILSVGGLVMGIMGMQEEDVRPIPPRAATALCAGMSVLLFVLFVNGF